MSCIFLVCGCKEPTVEKALKTPDDIKNSRKQKAKSQRKATPESKNAPWQSEMTSDVKVEEPTPKPTVTMGIVFPTPRVIEPITISAKDMNADNGQEDGQGGWILWSNGATQIDNVKINFPIREIDLEVRGDPALGIWPEVDLNMYNRTNKVNYFPWGIRQSVTTSTYVMMPKAVFPPLPPGDYLIVFRYYNNTVGGDPKEDRNAYLRKIILKP